MSSNKSFHLTLSERIIIETGITNDSTKSSIADTLGKDKSTIGKEIKLRRQLTYSCKYPIDCTLYPSCKKKNSMSCNVHCPSYDKFKCNRRDRSPGACNGCSKYSSCRYDKYKYNATKADAEYHDILVNTRIGVNATVNQIRELGLLIKPLLDKGQSVYVILQEHPEIGLTEKTIYTYIEDGVFQDAGVSITCLDLKRQVRRKIMSKKNQYSPRTSRLHLKGRTRSEFEEYMESSPNAKIVQMDTVYNDVSNGPFLQTFKFLSYDLLFCIYHEVKDSEHMMQGILLLESILGEELFSEEVEVLVTDRGSEFTFAEKIEKRSDGTTRTHVFYCDAMASWQKGSVENVHLFIREIFPKKTNLYELGLDSQEKANLISSHINSYPKEKLNGKTSFSVLEFYNPDMANKLYNYGLTTILPDQITLKPYLLKK